MNAFMSQYPDSGYSIKKWPNGMLTVTCPMHGDFDISDTNFLYFRGCRSCRGVHARAYPLRSDRGGSGSPVFITDDGSITMVKPASFLYGVGYSDKRVAEVVRNTVEALLSKGELQQAKAFMDKAVHFTPKPGQYVKKWLFDFVEMEPIEGRRGRRVDVVRTTAEKYPESGYIIKQEDYKGSNADIKVTCPDHGDFFINWRLFTRKQGCPQCIGRHHRGRPIGTSRQRVVFILKVCDGYYTLGSNSDPLGNAVFAASFDTIGEAVTMRTLITETLCLPGDMLDEAGFQKAKQLITDNVRIPEDCKK